MNRAIFLDRDGTINVEKHYLHKIEDFTFLPNAIEGLKLLQNAGYLLVIVTNQSGIGRGYYTVEDFLTLNDWMLEILINQGVKIDKVYFCPHHPEARTEKYRVDCECRKPKVGMYQQAITELDIDVDASFAIGDKIRDCSICEQTNCQGFLIAENEKSGIIAQVKNGEIARVHYADNLYESAKLIVNSI